MQRYAFNSVLDDFSIDKAKDCLVYEWSNAWVTADIARGSTLTHTYTAAASDVKVVCVATRAGYATLKDSLTTTVNAGAAVSLSLSVNNLTVTVVSVSGAPTSISWGDGSTATSVSDNMTHTYSASGTYTITATYAAKGYGLLYNWSAAVDTFRAGYAEVATSSSTSNPWECTFPSGHRRGICPKGWHLPTDAEWNTMEKEVSGDTWQTSYETIEADIRGSHAGKLSTSCDWSTRHPGNTNAQNNYSNSERNNSGFSAVPAGAFTEQGTFTNTAGYNANFWSSTPSTHSFFENRSALSRQLNYVNGGVSRDNIHKYCGKSVRCVHDEGITPSNVSVTLGGATASSLKATASADDNGSEITGYEYCISTNADMSGAACENATEAIHTFTGLSANTTYYVTVKATNAGGSATSAVASASTTAVADDCAGNRTPTPCTVTAAHAAQTGDAFTGNGHNGANDGLETVNGSGQVTSVTDYDGNVYPVVQIGSQCWLAENLRVTHSPKTGTYLVNTAGKTGNNAAQYYGSKVAHWYGNDSTTYAPKGYGLLYNWCAVMDTANPATTFTPYMEVPTPTAGNNGYFSFKPSGNHRGICPRAGTCPRMMKGSRC